MRAKPFRPRPNRRSALLIGQAVSVFGGGEEGDERSVEYWERVALEGDVRAMVHLGVVADDQGDEATARRWFERAVEAGDGWSAHQLAAMTYNTDPVEARRLCELAAERGQTAAKVALGKVLFREDRDAAWRWIEEAAEEDDGWAVGMMAHRFLRRHPMSQSRRSRHHSELMDLLRRGSELGDPYSMYTYGHRLMSEGEDDEARTWLTKAAEAKVEPAQRSVEAFRYDRDLGRIRFSARPGSWVRFIGSVVRYGLPRRRTE